MLYYDVIEKSQCTYNVTYRLDLIALLLWLEQASACSTAMTSLRVRTCTVYTYRQQLENKHYMFIWSSSTLILGKDLYTIVVRISDIYSPILVYDYSTRVTKLPTTISFAAKCLDELSISRED